MASDRYIFLTNAILDREKIEWIDRENGSVTIHFSSGSTDVWDGENARRIWVAFGPDNEWQKDGREK